VRYSDPTHLKKRPRADGGSKAIEMAIKVIVLLKRKPGMTPEAFRHAYETGHARLAVKLFGHLWIAYRRHYLGSANSFVDVKGAPAVGSIAETSAAPFDVITELVFENAAALEEMNRIVAQNRALLAEDEERMFDRPNCLLVMCDTVEEDLSRSRLASPGTGAVSADQT
jgi:hypothetical protein